MGNRLSKIYTRTGDDGTTGLGDGSRVPKDDARVEAYGTVDEANSIIGMILAENSVGGRIRDVLTDVQHDLFELGGELCIPGHTAVTRTWCESVWTTSGATIRRPGRATHPDRRAGGPAAAACHLARTVVRRAERRTQTLAHASDVRPEVLRYLNRLSDLLFVIARTIARSESGQEVLWNRDR